ncbi:hypothetical protein [Massilia horti]|uniref:Regulatory protein, RpfE type n=1 Tax=Massilia horti TaxID=2562153 RepID=A0A4Y9T5H3_9BURK|nr:hypothetical protein [Massilia horti]TFW33062.1 hypothetical protein E4O92_07880 [Massilia horti]
MAHITLVLPFALPAPEFATDLARALKAPALAALLSRTVSTRLTPADPKIRALPHETWLARTLGLHLDGQPAFARAAMRGYGLDPVDGTWFIVNPAHIEIARSHLLMSDLRHLHLSDEDSRALFDAARPSFDEAGHAAAYGDANTWFLRADDWAGMDTASPDAAVGMNLTDWMPLGQRALAFRKLQNEIQMVWHTHPSNASRAEHGLAPVNALWLWSGAPTSIDAHPAATPKSGAYADIATFEVPSWLAALGTRKLATLDPIASDAQNDTLLVCGNVAAPAIAADWSSWLEQMQRLEAELFAPLLAALTKGSVKDIRLVLSHRDGLAEFTTTALAQRKFWRRPTLDRLI